MNQTVAPSGKPAVLRVPQWKAHRWLMHGFSTRQGGVSTVYARESSCGDLNLGFTGDDTRENVLRNRELFVRAVAGGRARRARSGGASPLALLRQIHSGLIHRGEFAGPVGNADRPLRGDGWISSQSGVLLGILTADCLPILVVDVKLRVVAAFHAGWRGTLARIAERGVGRLRAEYGSRPEDLTAAIGPGIGACCYSVGEEVRMEFSSQFSYADALFQEVFNLDPIKQKYPMLFLTARAPGHSNLGPSLHLNLAEANQRQLQDAGIQPAKIHRLDLCTACNGEQFFSHRAEQGFTGRMLSVIGIAEQVGAADR
jgi:YfiH family protein